MINWRDHKRAYKCWVGMRERCRSPRSCNWTRYGARGIAVCDRWQVFANFLEDMGDPAPRMSLDRINNDGNYEPGNCRWATPREQQRNKRTTKLTQGAVDAIRAARLAGMSIANVQIHFPVSKASISLIASGKLWAS